MRCRSHQFYGDGGGFAAADAQAGDAALFAARFQRMQQRGEDAGAGCADRVTQRARAAIDVDFGMLDRKSVV